MDALFDPCAPRSRALGWADACPPHRRHRVHRSACRTRASAPGPRCGRVSPIGGRAARRHRFRFHAIDGSRWATGSPHACRRRSPRSRRVGRSAPRLQGGCGHRSDPQLRPAGARADEHFSRTCTACRRPEQLRRLSRLRRPARTGRRPARTVAAHRGVSASHDTAHLPARSDSQAATCVRVARRGVRQDSGRARDPRRCIAARNGSAIADGVRSWRSAAPISSNARANGSRRANRARTKARLVAGAARVRRERRSAATAIVLAAAPPRAAGRIYNVAERESFSELEWIRLIAAAVDWHGDLVVLPADRAPADAKMPGNLDQHWVVDTTRIREELGYQEPVAREASIAQTIAWERTNLPTRARR
jgi:hypothetical protein